jgi:hypothetical protein
MPFISVTRLRLRSVRFLPRFALHTMGAQAQIRGAHGYQDGALLQDRRWTFWTMTAWDSQDSMRAYMTNGPHRTAMPHLVNWCDEASVVHWDQQDVHLPSWQEADRRMRESGRTSKIRHPSPQHATMSFAPPRVTRTASVSPAKPR